MAHLIGEAQVATLVVADEWRLDAGGAAWPIAADHKFLLAFQLTPLKPSARTAFDDISGGHQSLEPTCNGVVKAADQQHTIGQYSAAGRLQLPQVEFAQRGFESPFLATRQLGCEDMSSI